MEEPLWTTAHRPTLDELVQDDVRSFLRRAVDEPMNLVLYGPPGVGKTAAVRALAAAAHDSPDDLVTINVADFFGLTKDELAADPRFAGFITPGRRRNTSKAGLINHVLTELAAYPPVTGSYKTVLLDNAEAMREDFQQALRRVMERHHRATQFVLTTRRPSKLIAPVRSRCLPLRMRSPTGEEIVAVLEPIVEAEGVPATADGLEYVAGYADGDLRRAILGAQTIAVDRGEITMEAAYEVLNAVGVDDRVRDLLAAADEGRFDDARDLIDELLIDEGQTGDEILGDLVRVARSRYQGPQLAALHRLVGEVDAAMTAGVNDRLHLARLAAELEALEDG